MRRDMKCLAALAALVLTSAVNAAVITIIPVQETTNGTLADANLTTIGSSDWAIWGGGGSIANTKLGSTSFSTVSETGGGGGWAEAVSGNTFTYTNGTSPATGSAVGGGNYYRVESPGKTLSFTLPLGTATSGTLDLWVAGAIRAQGTFLTAAVTGGTQTIGTPQPDYSNVNGHYQVGFSGVTAGDTMAVSYGNTGATDYNGRLAISAAALSVPEPASFALIGLGLMAFPMRRRRQA